MGYFGVLKSKSAHSPNGNQYINGSGISKSDHIFYNVIF